MGPDKCEPLEDLASAQRLHQALAEAGHLQADRNGNNPVRHVRLPIGCNTKYHPSHPHRLRRFAPDGGPDQRRRRATNAAGWVRARAA